MIIELESITEIPSKIRRSSCSSVFPGTILCQQGGSHSVFTNTGDGNAWQADNHKSKHKDMVLSKIFIFTIVLT
jgi:hypothetical protein